MRPHTVDLGIGVGQRVRPELVSRHGIERRQPDTAAVRSCSRSLHVSSEASPSPGVPERDVKQPSICNVGYSQHRNEAQSAYFTYTFLHFTELIPAVEMHHCTYHHNICSEPDLCSWQILRPVSVRPSSSRLIVSLEVTLTGRP